MSGESGPSNELLVSSDLPNYPRHLGCRVREDYLAPRGLSQVELARQLGWNEKRLTTFLEEQRDLSEEEAAELAAALGTSAQFLLNLQRIYHDEKM
jgi:addiction module HigA family antidote